MNLQDQHIELFDRYIKNQLNGQELLDFEAMLENDANFKAEFEQYRTMVAGIKEFERLQLKAFLSENGKSMQVKKGPNYRNYFYIAASVALIVMLSTLIRQSMLKPINDELAVAPKTVAPQDGKIFNENDPHEIIASPTQNDTFVASPKIIQPNKTVVVEENEMLDDENPPAIPDYHSFEVSPELGSGSGTFAMKDEKVSTSKKIAPQSEAAKANDYEVLTDQKIKDTVVYPVLITLKESKKKLVVTPDYPTVYNKVETKKVTLPKNSNDSKNVSQTEVMDTSVTILTNSTSKSGETALSVQFWTSPVHFKGYNYINNTVQLYGLDPNNVRLFYIKNVLYLRTEGIVYVLNPCSNACSYKIEDDYDIIRLILLEK